MTNNLQQCYHFASLTQITIITLRKYRNEVFIDLLNPQIFVYFAAIKRMSRMTTYISLDRMRFYAYHGVLPQERVKGNEFIVDLRLRVDVSQAMVSDEVMDTVNYAEVYEAVKKEMAVPSNLLEHVVGRIAKRLFKEFPTIEEIEVKLSKRNPPMGADINVAAVECSVARHEI